MQQHSIIDNRTEKLVEHVNLLLESSDHARFAVGYFFLSGFEAIEEELRNLSELRLLIGNTSTRETIEHLAEGHRELSAIKNATDALAYSSRAVRKVRAAETAENISDCIETMPQTDETEQLMQTLVEMIRTKRLKVRVYTKGRLHAKAYIFSYKQGVYDIGTSIVGSSNLTLAGLTSNTELNVVVSGKPNQEVLQEWFDALWEESEDFDEALMTEMQASWVLAPVSPYDIYMKTVYELVKERLERDADELTPTAALMAQLADFQQVAVWQAIRMINQYGGAFVSDVVGLGKSFIGSAIVKYFEQVENARPLILCPPALMPMWDDYNEFHHLNAQVVSSGVLSGDRGTAENLLFERYENRDFVLVDESHNFRNPQTQRYELLQRFLTTGEKKCCFLTATPRNKSAWDIYHQFKLFHPDDETRLPLDPSNLRTFFRGIETGTHNLRDVLQHILIRRTRNHILRWYGYDAETDAPVDPSRFAEYLSHRRRAYIRIGEKQHFFPQRMLNTVEYSIEETYQGLYEQIRGYLGTAKTETAQLTYARYGLWHYVKREKRDQSPYQDLQSAGRNLRGLIRVLLFKRFESSVYAFKRTISRFLNVHLLFLEALDAGVVAAGEEAQRVLYEEAGSETDIDTDERDVLDELRKFSDSYKIEDFDVAALRADIQHDIDVLRDILAPVKKITAAADTKLQRLKKLLETEPLNTGKRLIFTRYVDTANYLYKHLQSEGTAVIYSSNTNKQRIVARFAPKANPENRRTSGTDEGPINTLIATDVLAEGLNLQDCGMLINYDLHWNPVRLIQRFGRIDRIGSEFEKIYGFNFLPEVGIEQNLGLTETLHNRIQEIHDTIGEDAAILDNTEQLNEEAMYAIYEGDSAALNLLEETQATGISFTEAEEILRQMRRQDPEAYERIVNLRDGIRTGIPNATKGTYIFCRSGAYQQARVFDEEGNLVTTDPGAILQHLQCGPELQGEPLPSEHNARVTKYQKAFAAENRRRRAASPQELTNAQKYIRRELRALGGSSAEARRLDAVFRLPLPEAIKREINRLHRGKVTGESLLRELTILYQRYNMADMARSAEPSAAESESGVKVICSAAFV